MGEALSGDLAQVRLASLLQLAEGEMFTGWLRAPGGAIGLYQGAIVSASRAGASGWRALAELFLVRSGAFTLEQGEVAAAPPLGSTVALVMEGVRLCDEWDRVAPLVLLPVDRAEPLGAVDRRFLGAFDGVRSVAEVTRDLGASASAVADPLRRLLELGSLVEVAPPRQAAADPPLDYFDALEAGRLHLRRGQPAEAAAAFRAALAARPDDRIALQNLKRSQALLEEARSARVRAP